jgi:putative peptidoglycan lipid II flippase
MTMSEPVRQAVRNFFPVMISRGAVQLSAYIDQMIASLLPTGAVTAITNAQLLYLLPVSLFGVSISASELPAMAGDAAGPAGHAALRERLDGGLRRIAFFVIPSAAAFIALGDVIAAGLLQRGLFTSEDATYVWGILAGSSIGLLATTMARLYSVAHYAIGDTRRPLWIALMRVALSSALGYAAAVLLPPWLGIDLKWGAAGLGAAAGITGWFELALLRSSLRGRIGHTGLGVSYAGRLWIAAIAAAALGVGIKVMLPPLDPLVRAAVILPAFGAVFITAAFVLRIPIPRLGR